MASSMTPVFWKPGASAPGADREAEREGTAVMYNPNARLSLPQQRAALPIYKNRRHILYLLESHQIVIVVGDTGCGKTTQVPQYLHEAGWSAGGRVVGCTQPRRVAAQTVAARVAEEMGCVLGSEVGYSIRFDDKCDPMRTRIKYLTDGMLLREMMLDPLLSRYSVVMVDEAHERSLYTEVLLGLLKKILKKRKDMRLIVSSATIEAESFRTYFGRAGTAIMSVQEGRVYPVEVHYRAEPISDYLSTAAQTVLDIHLSEPAGDILVFLTGAEEIDHCVRQIHELMVANSRDETVTAIAMYSAMSPERQLAVFDKAPEGTRKCIVATNIAETSVTIPGIVYVIDCGFVKLRSYDALTATESLVVAPVSRASAMQRSGRSGRIRPGKAYRLYTEDAFRSLGATTVPEMQRCNLAAVVLQLKALGIDDVLHFHFLSPPSAEAMARALEMLYALGAIDDNCQLTNPLGVRMAEFPCDPMMTRMLLAAGENEPVCSEEVLTIAAMLSVQNIYLPEKDCKIPARSSYGVKEGDHLTMLNVYNAFVKSRKDRSWCQQRAVSHRALSKAVEIRGHLRKYMVRFSVPIDSCGGDVDAIRKAIVAGYFNNAAKQRSDGTYSSVRGDLTLRLHPTSVLFKFPPRWIVFHEVVATSKAFMRDAILVQPTWLTEAAPHFYTFAGDGTASTTVPADARPAKSRRLADISL